MINTSKTDDDGLRVSQSVQLVSHLPAIIFINVTSALVMFLLLTNVGVLWKQMLPVLVIWPSMLPLLASWLRLQGRPVPQAVSTRRIRRIVEFSFYLGAAWGGIMTAATVNGGAGFPKIMAAMRQEAAQKTAHTAPVATLTTHS